MRILLFIICLGSVLFSGHAQTTPNSGIVTRADWKAQEPAFEMKRHIPRYITIHHTATTPDPEKPIAEKLQALQKFSFSEGFLGDGTPKKAWADVPYHFYIATDGTIAEGREIEYEGDSNTNYDLTGHALVVLEGNFNQHEPGEAQWKSLQEMVYQLAKKYKVPADKITGHKDQAPTSCPGNSLYNLLPLLRKKIDSANIPRVIIGAEQLLTPEFEHLVKNKKLGLITNHTGVLPNGQHLIDLLNEDPDVHLQVLFGPEHGLRGEQDTHVADGVDAKTKLPFISLYGKTRKPTPEMLKNLDVLVFDIQDIGARYYTYIETMMDAMEAAAEENLPFIVLDRPNPITGNYVDGPLQALKPKKELGFIPITHGMTVGELAKYFNAERKRKGLPVANLHVVPLQNYSRDQWYNETGLPWIKPSPNMLTLQTAVVYPATCLLEGTNYSEARGTNYPFEHFGAPWVDSEKLSRQLNSYKLTGVRFEPKKFVPDSIVDGIKIYPPKFLGDEVNGVEMIVTDPDNFQSAEAGVYILHALRSLYPEKFEWRIARIDGLLGTSAVREQLNEGKSPAEIVRQWKEDVSRFREMRKAYLLY